jgi:hypothetical protein
MLFSQDAMWAEVSATIMWSPRKPALRRSPWHRWYERADDDGNGGRCESDREYDQARHRRPIVPEISERCVVRRVEQYGCHEERQRQLGRQRKRRCHRKKREQRTAERQENRIGGSDPAGCTRQDHGGNEEPEKLFEFPHTAGRWLNYARLIEAGS